MKPSERRLYQDNVQDSWMIRSFYIGSIILGEGLGCLKQLLRELNKGDKQPLLVQSEGGRKICMDMNMK